MLDPLDAPTIPLPEHWRRCVHSAVLHIVALARWAAVQVHGWAANSVSPRVYLTARLEQAQQEIAILREELRIKDGCMAQIAAHRRPQYTPTERMAILELRAARGWNQDQAAKAMLVTPATVAAWMRRIDEQGPDALVQLPEPVNRFPDFVRHIVRRLKALCPSMGKVRIAKTLARAGPHLAATTVGHVLKEKGGPQKGPTPEAQEADVESQDQADASKKRGEQPRGAGTAAAGSGPQDLLRLAVRPGAATRETLMTVLHTLRKRTADPAAAFKGFLDRLAEHPDADPHRLLFAAPPPSGRQGVTT